MNKKMFNYFKLNEYKQDEHKEKCIKEDNYYIL